MLSAIFTLTVLGGTVVVSIIRRLNHRPAAVGAEDPDEPLTLPPRSLSLTHKKLSEDTMETLAGIGSGRLDCCICLENLARGDLVVVLACEHSYHKDCIGAYLKVSANAPCPVCRTFMSTTTPEKKFSLSLIEEYL